MLASACLLIGLVLGGCGATVLRAWSRKHEGLPARDAVNVFDGTVFPAPHDARWRRVEAQDGSGADVFVFGDRDIRLSATTLSLGWADCRTIVASSNRVTAYYSDVQRCYYEFRQTLALQAVESAILNAGFGNDEAPTGDAVPEKREAPRLVAASDIDHQQATAMGKFLLATGQQNMRAPAWSMSPVFRVDDDHVLPHPNADGWKHGNGEGAAASVYIQGGNHTLSVFKNGAVWLDGGEWVRHPKAIILYGLVVARLPPKESTADKQRKAADEMLAKLTKARA